MQTKIGRLSFDGVEMRYLTFGEGQKTFVILPGLSIGSVLDAAKSIAEAYAAFAKEYTVYLFDRRENLPPEYPIIDMARDTLGALDALGLTKVALFGVSQGGMIAQEMAIARPEAVTKLVLGSTLSRFGDGEKWMEELLELAAKGKKIKLTETFARMIYTEDFMKKYGGALKLSALKTGKKDLGRFMILARGCIGFSSYDRLDRIVCPTLVLGAEHDRVVSGRASLEIAEKLGCACYLYPAPYGHAVYDEAPDYKDRILAFLRS